MTIDGASTQRATHRQAKAPTVGGSFTDLGIGGYRSGSSGFSPLIATPPKLSISLAPCSSGGSPHREHTDEGVRNIAYVHQRLALSYATRPRRWDAASLWASVRCSAILQAVGALLAVSVQAPRHYPISALWIGIPFVKSRDHANPQNQRCARVRRYRERLQSQAAIVKRTPEKSDRSAKSSAGRGAWLRQM